MAFFLRCPAGHRWEVGGQSDTFVADEPVACPVCGVPCRPLVDPSTDGSSEWTSSAVSFAEHPTTPFTARFPPQQSKPSIPGYEILDLLGQGGMGQVWRARDTRLNRLVALKVILAGPQATPTQRARFQLEAEALASLKHPNIVQIYDVREQDGMSCLALELVEGGSLSQLLSSRPQEPRRAASVVRTLALAMHAAHLRGIIHRDLKPANVMMQRQQATSSGTLDTWQAGTQPSTTLDEFEPKITDFGLAKRFEGEDSNTMPGVIVGTPSYMAPEQTSGDPHATGPLTDVYALGAILYEMLTGRPPFQGGAPLATIKMVQESEPAPPRRLQPQAPRDLELICLKCLRKEPGRRYASAEALAEDLRRFLELEPIQARPTPLWERMWKWSRRRPTAAALIGVSSVALIAFLILLTWSNRELRIARDRAEEKLNLASEAVEEMYARVAEEWLADEPHKDPLQREFLEKALKLSQIFVEESGNDPKIRRQRALAYFRLGQIYRTFDEAEKAREHYDQAIALQDELAQEFSREPAYQRDLAKSYNWRGELFREAMKFDRAEEDYLRALPLRQALAGGAAEDPSHQVELAETENNLGLVAHERGRLEEANRYYDQAVARLLALHRAGQGVAGHDLGRWLINRGVNAKLNGRFNDAEADYRRAIDLLAHKLPGRSKVLVKRDLAVAFQDLANLYFAQDKAPEALEVSQKALAIIQPLVDDFPERGSYQRKLANVHNTLGGVYSKLKKKDDAAREWQRAWDLLAKLGAGRNEKEELQNELLRGRVQGNLGLLHGLDGDFKAAREWLVPAVGRLEKVWRKNQDNVAAREALSENARNLAEVALQLRDHEEAARAAGLLAAARARQFQDDYYAACFFARASRTAEKDSEPAMKYLGQAIKLLKRAAEGGRAVERFSGDEGILAVLEVHLDYSAILAQFTPPK